MATKKTAAKKTAVKKTKASAAGSTKKSPKAKFTVQQLKDIHAALNSNPATKNLADRVIHAIHDPGVTLQPA